MKAVLLREFGEADKLQAGDLPTPKPGPGEVVVRVRACALNHLDLHVRNGIPAYRIKPPHVLGSDVAGEIAQVGEGVEGWSEGDKTVLAPGVSCMACEFCLAGQDQRCGRYGILGATGGWGGYAEYIKVPARNALPYPGTLSWEEAAAFPLTYLTAWHMLFDLAELKPGQSVLIIGGGAGVSLAAIDICRYAGARCLVSTRSAEKAKAAKAFGADETVVSPPEDLHRAALKFTGGDGVDCVFEHVGPAVFDKALRSLKKGGTLATCGSTTGPIVELDMRYVFSRELRIAGARMGPLSEMRTIARLVGEGKFHPKVDSVFPLEDARKAHERLAQGGHFGKVVLRVG